MSTRICLIKTVIYALFRRVTGVPRHDGDAPHIPMSMHEAQADLQHILDSAGASSNVVHQKKAGVYKLASKLIPKLSPVEYTPASFERVVGHKLLTLCSTDWSNHA